jgi:hypothetical protein
MFKLILTKGKRTNQITKIFEKNELYTIIYFVSSVHSLGGIFDRSISYPVQVSRHDYYDKEFTATAHRNAARCGIKLTLQSFPGQSCVWVQLNVSGEVEAVDRFNTWVIDRLY